MSKLLSETKNRSISQHQFIHSIMIYFLLDITLLGKYFISRFVITKLEYKIKCNVDTER